MFAITMVVAMVPSVILHEIAHAYTADAFGDSTARRAGRLSLNPIRHIDPVGSVLVPTVMVLLLPFVIAWAKPVPVDPSKFREHPWSDIRVSMAGIVANIGFRARARSFSADLIVGFDIDGCLGDFCQLTYQPACLLVRLRRCASRYIAVLCAG